MDIETLLRELGIRVDEDLPPAFIKRISVALDDYQLSLRQAGLLYDVPNSSHRPSAADLDRSATHAISESVRSAGMIGAAGGLAGALSLPPEALARVIQSFRLAQRLVIIYGHDPLSDRGGMLVRRALSAAWEFELPPQANIDIKLSDIGGVIRAGLPAAHDGPAWMARTLAKTATAAVGRRFSRWIPGLGVGMGLIEGRRLARAQGGRMHHTFRVQWRGPQPTGVEDAIEILS
jgi:hypothetical protein